MFFSTLALSRTEAQSSKGTRSSRTPLSKRNHPRTKSLLHLSPGPVAHRR
jgi:hypothetical protein